MWHPVQLCVALMMCGGLAGVARCAGGLGGVAPCRGCMFLQWRGKTCKDSGNDATGRCAGAGCPTLKPAEQCHFGGCCITTSTLISVTCQCSDM